MPACELISNYLSNLHRCVKILNNRSTWRTLSKGVPQGPLLFNIFMNDVGFFFIKSCNFDNYAYDNFVSRSASDANVMLSNLKKMSKCQISLKWFDDNGIKANPSKFKFMIMSSEKIEPQILTVSDDVCLQSQTDVKVLRDNRWLPTNFQWTYSYMYTESYQAVNALPLISKYMDTKTINVLYHSSIASNFNHCPIVWGFGGVIKNNILEKNPRAFTAHSI